ncbi:hypothetical protein [Marinomonas fungiae]|uniref:Uncharacterized protein n=1 Tax=Marinomonas fungiae TaxID=1137284 RepID=A0A0K6IPA6_9GAMM|nr:hypothetical protein [Marinomonas fungiae]CUB04931.1 hypothetical protein Ga0061065_108154 [Marinomonas fungiae]
MKIGGSFPVIPQGGSDYSSRSKVPAVTNQDRQQGSSIPLPSTVQSFEQASSAQSARFFKVDGLSALAQQAIEAYQSTESLSPNNPRHQLIGIDVYA